MDSAKFLAFNLLLTVGLVAARGEFQEYFDPDKVYRQEAKRLGEELARARLQYRLSRYELEAFRADVAVHLPEAVKSRGSGEKGYPLRRLASAVMAADESLRPEVRARQIFLRAKEFFRLGKYAEANRLFAKHSELFSFSVDHVEALFLLAEGHYQLGQKEDAIRTIETMIQLYPTSELTGMAMVRLGQIYEESYRKDDALAIYQTLLRTFPQREIASEAERRLRAVEL